MSLPTFTADFAVYRTANRYHTSASTPGNPAVTGAVTLAYMPGSGTQRTCYGCTSGCAKASAWCDAGAVAALSGCVFPPACPFAAAAAGAALALCNVGLLACMAECAFSDDCCPKACSTPNPLDPGAGCCDKNEGCVDRYDPNARQGCCPSDQLVCAGKCCAKGDSCCGGSCCPPNYYCLDGFCSEHPGKSLWPDNPTPPKPPRGRDPRILIENSRYCGVGTTPCGSECCPPHLQCCFNYDSNRWGCRTTCLH
jgi:hypothetical protein